MAVAQKTNTKVKPLTGKGGLSDRFTASLMIVFVALSFVFAGMAYLYYG